MLSLLEDPEVAHDILRALIRDIRAQRRNGKPVPSWATPVLQELAATCGADQPDIGTRFATVETRGRHHMVSVAEAAQAVARSKEYIRRLVRTKRVIGERIGARTWAVDLDSLRGVLDRAA